MTCSENQVSKPIAPSFYVIIIITNILVVQIKFVLGGKKVTGTRMLQMRRTCQVANRTHFMRAFLIQCL